MTRIQAMTFGQTGFAFTNMEVLYIACLFKLESTLNTLIQNIFVANLKMGSEP